MVNRPIVRPAISVDTSQQRGPVSTATPLTGGQGKLVGRVIVEEFEKADPTDDGIFVKISYLASDDPGAMRAYGVGLVRRVITKLEPK